MTVSTSVLVDALFRTKIRVKVAVFVALGYSSIIFAVPCPTPQTLSPEFSVHRIIDGDTLIFDDGSRVRLAGLNSFELKDPSWKGRSAREAKRKVTEWLLKKKVRLTPWPAAADRYGRLLGNLWFDNRYLGELLVAEGLALAVAVPPQSTLAGCLSFIEGDARKARKGFWSLGQLPERIQALDKNGFRFGLGSVTEIIDSKSFILEGRLRVLLPKPDPNVKIGTRFEVRGWVSRSPKWLRKEVPWTLKLKDMTNKVRVF
ncbi:MAG: hypothetical protein CMD54_00160 [Gammaproteobacteria bacterium]|nr:hypothetical protein [Gammaproteobacteria bacterium]HAN80953.1 hypothetical protein [Gammaproteobacteria bacterium]